MSKNTLVFLSLTLLIMVFSALLVYFRTASMAIPSDLAKRGLATLKRENLIFFGVIVPIVVGLISIYTYRHWYTTNQNGFLMLAFGIGVGFSILAAIFYKNAFWEFTALHIAYIIALGWLMPRLLV